MRVGICFLGGYALVPQESGFDAACDWLFDEDIGIKPHKYQHRNMVGVKGVIGIRRENKSYWERRCPLVPEDVKTLVESGIQVLIQSSKLRCFPDEEYVRMGAEIREDLTSANVILGIKEVGVDQVIPGQTYLMFAHVAKAQPYNMPLLDKLLELGVRVVDYEYIQEQAPPNNRLIAFGRFAGIGGVIDYFRGLGLYLLKRGVSSPFIYIGSSYMYPDISQAKVAVQAMGAMIATEGIPTSISPLVIGVAGNGRVGKGAMEILQLLPHTLLTPDQLSNPEVYLNPSRQIFIVVFTEEHMAERKDGSQFAVRDYYRSPELYKPVFSDRYLSYLSVLVNCIFYDNQYPKLLTIETMRNYVASGQKKFLGVCDISCDRKGAIEFTRKFTDPETPWVLYNSEHDRIYEISSGHCGDSFLLTALDFIPSEFARDSSLHFSKINVNYAKTLAWDDPNVSYSDSTLPPEIKGAILTWAGQLTPRFQYITELRNRRKVPQIDGDTVEKRFTQVLNSHPDFVSDLTQIKHGEPVTDDLKQAIRELAEAINFHQ